MSYLISIGRFAQITRLTVKALHIYDELGLLRPIHTDADSGYRYYSITQLPLARRIRLLRSIDMSLDSIHALLQAPTPAAMEALLHEHQQRIARSCLFLLALSALGICLAPVLWPIFLINLFRSVTSGLIFPTLGALMSSHVAPHEQGALMGVSTALGSLMNILGPLCAGAAYDHVMPSAPYWMGAGVFVLAACLLMPAALRDQHAQPSR